MLYRVKLLLPKSKSKATSLGHGRFMIEKSGKLSTFKTVVAARTAAKAWQIMNPRGTYAIMKMPLKVHKKNKKSWRNLQNKVW